MEEFGRIIFSLIFALFMIVYGVFTWALIVYQYYHWFALPLYPQLPTINFEEAIGLSFLISLFKTHSSLAIKDEYRDKTLEYAILFLGPWFLLLVGYIFRLSY